MSVKRCFRVSSMDNVATLLEDAGCEQIEILGSEQMQTVNISEPISLGHKVALRLILKGAEVVKYGVPIGIATANIQPGEWVHLHNCRSQIDIRSSQFVLSSGPDKDVSHV